jgi:hypothetical protein
LAKAKKAAKGGPPEGGSSISNLMIVDKAEMLSFAFRNPDQSVTSYDKAFGSHGNVAKGNQFC